MSLDFSEFIDILDGDEFEQKPVDLRTFVTSPDYLALPPLSENQYTLIEKVLKYTKSLLSLNFMEKN